MVSGAQMHIFCQTYAFQLPIYIRNAAAVVAVFDTTRYDSFKSLNVLIDGKLAAKLNASRK